ncbi:MAG TPA: TraR/DksA C4-type zinc finger protein [bacterium]
MAITKDQLKHFKQLLITERERIVGELRSLAQDALKTPRDASGDLSGYTVHMADMATDTHERELSMNVASNERELLYQIDDALKRIDDGSYGVCQACGKAITMSRLKAVPYALMCIECQRVKEQKGKP